MGTMAGSLKPRGRTIVCPGSRSSQLDTGSATPIAPNAVVKETPDGRAMIAAEIGALSDAPVLLVIRRELLAVRAARLKISPPLTTATWLVISNIGGIVTSTRRSGPFAV